MTGDFQLETKGSGASTAKKAAGGAALGTIAGAIATAAAGEAASVLTNGKQAQDTGNTQHEHGPSGYELGKL